MARGKALLTTNWHFVGVIIFFLVHGYQEHRGLIPFVEGLITFGQLTVAGFIIYGITRWLLRQPEKAGLCTSFILVLVLFFGAWQDALATIRPLTNLSRLPYFVPLLLLVMLLFFVWLKRTTVKLGNTIRFINLLLIIYLVVDGVSLLLPSGKAKKQDSSLASIGLTRCDTCAKPSVYLVLLDSYFGLEGMQQFFQYDNTPFEDTLRKKGFHVVARPRSNYASTIYSMGSMLNMKYLDLAGRPVIENHFDYSAAIGAIRNNVVCRYFEGMGYDIVNHSNFDLQHIPAGYESGLLPDKIRLITQQTMYSRLGKYLPVFIMSKGWAPGWQWEAEERFVQNNELMMERSLAVSSSRHDKPVFTWLHLMMPHDPFAYDSMGVRRTSIPRNKNGEAQLADADFLQYQVYTNKRINTFITQLQANTKGQAVILLMSDHGYRPAFSLHRDMPSINLNAVYLPGGQYAGWYDGLSNVNQFRVLFNKLYAQQLPLLKDSIVR